MSSYRELQSEYDSMPEFLEQSLMQYKIDVKSELDDLLNDLHSLMARDTRHSAKYYGILQEMIKGFMRKVYLTVLPKRLEPWWRYTYEISHKGITLYLEHIGSAWLDESTGIVDEETVDQVFPLVTLNAKMLTVDEYAKLYGVEQVTVRQWIRRGKLRSAEKAGNEWRISELTDVPQRARYEEATYRWLGELSNIPQELEYIKQYNEVRIVKRDINMEPKPGVDYVAILSKRSLRKQDAVGVELSEDQKEKLEYYLISNPDVLYTGDTRTYSYKTKPDKAEEFLDEEDDGGNNE